MPTSLKSQLSTVPLPDNRVMTPDFQDGSLPFQYTHKHSSPLRQALHTQIASHRSHSMSYKIFVVLEDFFEVPPSHMNVALTLLVTSRYSVVCVFSMRGDSSAICERSLHDKPDCVHRNRGQQDAASACPCVNTKTQPQ